MSILSKALKRGEKWVQKRGLFGEQYKTNLFEHTAEGKRLADIGREGIYTPKALSNIRGTVASQAGFREAGRTAGIRGHLASTGMLDSIASTRLLDRPGRETSRTMTDLNRRLSTTQEMSKVEALNALASGKTRSRDIRRGEREAYRSKYVGGALKAAGTIGGFLVGGPAGAAIGSQIGGVAAGGGAGGVNTAGLSSALSRYSFSVPENFAEMPYEEMYTWAKRQGMDIKEAEELWYMARSSNKASNNYTGGLSNPTYANDTNMPTGVDRWMR